MTGGFEVVPCPICGDGGQTPHLTLPDLAYGTKGRFHYVHCAHCGHLYQSPRPGSGVIGDYYPPSYEPFRKAIEEQTTFPPLRWLKHIQLRTRCLQIARLRSGGRLLDVGCSTGLFLNEMRRYGQWELCGVEPDAGAAQYARDRFGLDVYRGQLETTPWPAASFDVVTLWDVLEHLPDPAVALGRIRALLAPGGRLVFSVPNGDSIDARCFGPWWTGIDPPRHFSVFRKRDISMLLDASGLRAVRTYCFYGRYTTFAASLRLLFRARIPNRALRLSLERLVSLPAWRYVTLPYFALIDRLGLGAILTVVAMPK